MKKLVNEVRCLTEHIQSPEIAMAFPKCLIKADSPYCSSLSSYAATLGNARPRDWKPKVKALRPKKHNQELK